MLHIALLTISLSPNGQGVAYTKDKDYVRIEKATELWKIKLADENTTQIYLEGKSNAGGEVPNGSPKCLSKNPFKSLTKLKEYFEVKN